MSYQEVQVSLPGIKSDQIIIVYVEGEEEGEEGGMLVKYDLARSRSRSVYWKCHNLDNPVVLSWSLRLSL